VRVKIVVAIFIFLSSFVPNQAQATLICIAPVFRAEYMLEQLVSRYPERARELANNVLYLREKYCRQIPGTPEMEDSELLNETCGMKVGTYRGEKVYFDGACGD
jgi:hypothetical protein